MNTDKANEKGDKVKSDDSGCTPTGHGMFEMMKKCCEGQSCSPDCSTMMKGMMEAIGSHPCGSRKTGDTGSERREK